MADNPSLDEVTRSQKGVVSARVKEYASKPVTPPRKSRPINYSTGKIQNGSAPVEQSYTSSTRPKLRVVEKKNKFRSSSPVCPPSNVLPSDTNGTEPSDQNTGPHINVVSPESGTLQKAVCVTHEQQFETATEISLRDVSLHMTNSSHSSPVFKRALSPSSPENLDSSFDEMTSDEDVAADREMGEQLPLPSPKVEHRKPQPSHVDTGRRVRSSLLLKENISMSPSQKRKNIETLSESFMPGGSPNSPSIYRSQTFNEKSPRQREKERHSATFINRTSTVSTENESISVQSSVSSFVFVENSVEQVSTSKSA